MNAFLGFAIPGIPYGCTYAIVAVGLVLTFQATGVFNFAFGAQAYASAFIFTLMTVNHHVPVVPAFILSVVIMSPLLGLIFDRFLFRQIPNTNTTAKVVAGISLFVGIPELLPVIFGPQNLINTPSVVFNINTVYFHPFGQPVNGSYLTTVTVTVVVLIAMVALLRFSSLGLQMRGAVESRRLVQLDGVNAGGVVSIAWAISSFLAGLAGVLLAPIYGSIQPDYYGILMVGAISAAAWGALRSLPIAAGVGVLLGVLSTTLRGYLPTGGIWFSAALPAMPFLLLVGALIFVPGMRALDASKDPLASVDPPLPPTASGDRAPKMDRMIKISWYVLLAGFVISMLTWMPVTWEGVFNGGIALSILFLSITMITGMAGQLSLCQATLAGIGAFTSAQFAMHLHVNMLIGGLIGAVFAGVVAVILALASLRLRGLGLALMTLAFALFFDNTVFSQTSITNGQTGLPLDQSWVAPFNFFALNGHAQFILGMVVLTLSVIAVTLVRKGTIGRFLAAMRGSEMAASGLGINLTWQRILVFAMSGVLAGIGGTIFTIQQQSANATEWSYEFSLAFVVVVITTGVSTVEGAIQAGMGFMVMQQLLTYLPARFGGNSLMFVLFAFGSLTYAAHPEGILEYRKRKGTQRFERLFFSPKTPPDLIGQGAGVSGAGGAP